MMDNDNNIQIRDRILFMVKLVNDGSLSDDIKNSLLNELVEIKDELDTLSLEKK